MDGNSTDGTIETATKYGAKVVVFDTGVAKGKFDAPHRRNFGARMALGRFVYYVDADMELQPNVISEAVEVCAAGAVAVVVPEISFGSSMWARAKALERMSYIGDSRKEAPRFFVRSVWEDLGGLDESLGGGGDDWDLYEAVKKKGYLVGRTQSCALHNEGDLKLISLARKRFMYGQDSWRYFKKRPSAAFQSYSPIRIGYFRNWKRFKNDPNTTCLVLIMRLVEYSAGLAGIIVGLARKSN